MNRKLGRVMSNSRMVSFVAFLAAVFAWVLKMPALLTVSIVALLFSAALYLYDKYKSNQSSSGSSKQKKSA